MLSSRARSHSSPAQSVPSAIREPSSTGTPKLRTCFLDSPAKKISWCLFTGPGCSWGSVEMKGTTRQPPKAMPVQCYTGATCSRWDRTLLKLRP